MPARRTMMEGGFMDQAAFKVDYDPRYVNAGFFKALGDPTRLRLMVALAAFDCNLCVCELVYGLKIPQYRASKHLAVLSKHGLVTSSHRGTWVMYSASPNLPAAFDACMKSLGEAEPYRTDIRRIDNRRLLRDDQGLCAVGFVPEEQIDALIARARSKPTAIRR